MYQTFELLYHMNVIIKSNEFTYMYINIASGNLG